MPETSQLVRPRIGRLATIGGCGVASCLLWIAAGILAPLVESGRVPRVAFQLVAYGAIALTVSAVILFTSYLGQRAAADNHALILIAVGQIAAEQEALAAKFNKINPSAIYAAAVEDMLSSGDRT